MKLLANQRIVWPLAAWLAGGWSVIAASLEPAQIEFFEKRIRPVLVQSCYECHSAQHQKAKGGLLVDSKAALLKGGDNGPAIVPGDPDKSLLVKAVRRSDPNLEMPPKHKLDAQTIQDIEQWVKLGAADPRTEATTNITGIDWGKAREFWSFQPVREPPLPKVKNTRWVQSPIDRFVLAKLQEKGLKPAPATDKRTLIRRATYDLTGLPPTPEEIDAFLADKSPKAFECVVERLLASPAYGECWGRHWLDVARYADTAGCNSDFPIPPAYKYRNWVIDAFNADKPYDQFIREQVAGDLLPAANTGERARNIIATGYLAISRRFSSSTNEFHLTLEDAIDNLGKGLLGLSLSCARCHDHKYDPVPNEDFYALYGIFESSTYTFPGVELYPTPRDYVPLGAPEQVANWQKWEQELTDLSVRYEHLQSLTRGSRRATNDVEKIKTEMAEITKRKEQLRAHPPQVELAYAVTEGRPHDTRLQRKGDPHSLGNVVPRGFLQILSGRKLPKDCHASGRRELADWLTDPQNPLTTRVMVNRIWQRHFGKGIVQTPNDFGKRGKAPTHPELLDYLATRFIASGWSVKAMHRLILLSSTYQMSCADNAKHAALDVNNDYLWRFNRRRLSAEEIRDSLLFVSGTLDRTPGGSHPFPAMSTWHFTQHTPFVDVYPSDKRTVYLMQQRIRKHPFLELFDGADPNSTTGDRPHNTTPIQALFMMNAPLAHEQAAKFAERIQSLAVKEGDRISRAFEFVYGRLPAKDEIKVGEAYLKAVTAALREAGTAENQLATAAWASYSRVLLGSNEFIFVD